MKRIVGIVSLITLLCLASVNTFSQNWSKEQLEVWAVVEDSWDGWSGGDMDKVLATIHEDYQGWSNRDQLPVNKTQVKEMFASMALSTKLSDFFINPARIMITGNAAVVDYVFEFSAVYINGEDEMPYNVSGKNAEFYVKEGGNWQLLGDMTIMKSSDE